MKVDQTTMGSRIGCKSEMGTSQLGGKCLQKNHLAVGTLTHPSASWDHSRRQQPWYTGILAKGCVCTPRGHDTYSSSTPLFVTRVYWFASG